jgi:hypothetical protein
VSLAKTRPSLAIARPTPTRAAKIEEGEARLVVNMPAEEHRALKIRATERGLTIKAYVLALIRADAK